MSEVCCVGQLDVRRPRRTPASASLAASPPPSTEHDHDDAAITATPSSAAEGELQALAARGALGLRLLALQPLLAAALLFLLPAGHGRDEASGTPSSPCARRAASAARGCQHSSMKSAISPVSRSGASRSSRIELASSRRAVRQLLGEHAGVGERVDGVAPVADHERRRLDRAPLARGAARCGRRTGPGARRRSAPGPGARCRGRCRPATAAVGHAPRAGWTTPHHRRAERSARPSAA